MPQSYASSSKRQVIVDTAYALFKRHGFHATGIDRIIADAGVAKMTMYRHFPTKDALIVEVLQKRADRFERQLDDLDAGLSTSGDKVLQIFGWYERWFATADFHGCVFQHALAEFGDRENPIHKAASTQKSRLRDRVEHILSGALSHPAAGRLAMALVLLLEGATLLAQMGQGDRAIREARAAAVQLLASAGVA